jgi:hypothetical protein
VTCIFIFCNWIINLLSLGRVKGFLLIISICTALLVTFNVYGLGTITSTSAQEGKIRCTNGNLVRSSGECPSTDICPPPPSGDVGAVAQCSARESPSNTGKASSSNSNSNASFAVRTDKKTYHLGEEIKIIIENNGSQPFRTSGLNFALLVVNPATNVKYQIINTTEPILVAAADAGASRTFPWNQSDARGNQVNPGNYTASAILGPLRANSSFSIS